MGNHRFKLSDMMPNAWFYKLRDMNNRTSTTTTTTPTSANNNNNKTKSNMSMSNNSYRTRPTGGSLPPLDTRKSYYLPRDLSPKGPSLPDPPRRSSKHARQTPKKLRHKNPPAVAAAAAAQSPPLKPVSSSASFSCRASTDSVWTRTEDPNSPDSIFDCSSSPEFRLDRVLTPESLAADDPDIVIYVDENSFVAKPKRAMRSLNFDSASPNLELPRIVTKPAKPNLDRDEAKKPAKKPGDNVGSRRSVSRRSVSRRCSVASSPRLRLKIHSPRLGSWRPAQARRRAGQAETTTTPLPPPPETLSGRKKLSSSFAIMKSSFDPQRDFRESMVEMIVEHNIKASRDLEDLLACYLSLNSDEYHELIIEVFKQIWFDLTDINSIDEAG